MADAGVRPDPHLVSIDFDDVHTGGGSFELGDELSAETIDSGVCHILLGGVSGIGNSGYYVYSQSPIGETPEDADLLGYLILFQIATETEGV